MIQEAQSYHLKDVLRLSYEYYQTSPMVDRIEFNQDYAMDYLRRQMIQSSSYFPVYSIDDKAQGFAIAYLSAYPFSKDTRVNLEYIYVNKEHRSADVGQQLVQAVEAWAQSQNSRELLTGDIGIDPEVLKRWYQGQGYTYDGVCMTKRLR